MLSTGNLAHWGKPLPHILVKASATAAIFVLLGQGVPSLHTLGGEGLQNIAVFNLSAYEMIYYNRELSCSLPFVRREAL